MQYRLDLFPVLASDLAWSAADIHFRFAARFSVKAAKVAQDFVCSRHLASMPLEPKFQVCPDN